MSNTPGVEGERLLGLVTLATNAFDRGSVVALGFFGFHVLLLGYPAYESAFVPD